MRNYKLIMFDIVLLEHYGVNKDIKMSMSKGFCTDEENSRQTRERAIQIQRLSLIYVRHTKSKFSS